MGTRTYVHTPHSLKALLEWNQRAETEESGERRNHYIGRRTTKSSASNLEHTEVCTRFYFLIEKLS